MITFGKDQPMPATAAASAAPRYVLLFRGGRLLTDEERAQVRALPSLEVVGDAPFSATFLVGITVTEEEVRRDLDALGWGPWVMTVQRRYGLT